MSESDKSIAPFREAREKCWRHKLSIQRRDHHDVAASRRRQESGRGLEKFSSDAPFRVPISVVMDGSPDHGGRNLGVRPMETVLIGLGGCSAFDVMSMLKKGRQDVTNCEVHLEAERADEIPAVFTSIKLTCVIEGRDLSESQVQRPVDLSIEKYCSVTKMLESTVDISHEIKMVSN